MADPKYLSTDPNAGLPPSKYLSADPNAGAAQAAYSSPEGQQQSAQAEADIKRYRSLGVPTDELGRPTRPLTFAERANDAILHPTPGMSLAADVASTALLSLGSPNQSIVGDTANRLGRLPITLKNARQSLSAPAEAFVMNKLGIDPDAMNLRATKMRLQAARSQTRQLATAKELEAARPTGPAPVPTPFGGAYAPPTPPTPTGYSPPVPSTAPVPTPFGGAYAPPTPPTSGWATRLAENPDGWRTDPKLGATLATAREASATPAEVQQIQELLGQQGTSPPSWAALLKPPSPAQLANVEALVARGQRVTDAIRTVSRGDTELGARLMTALQAKQ